MSTKREDLINKHRYINVDGCFDWWECIESDLREDMAELGFKVGQMYFSGFASQGDGACFTGRMIDWKKFYTKVPEFVRDFPYLSEFLKDEGANYTAEHHGRYNHENCTSHEYDSGLEWEVSATGRRDLSIMSPDEMMRFALYQKALPEEEGVLDWLKDFFKGKMRKLYRDLEAEYNYLTSDEGVWESIVANELDEELEDEDAKTTDEGREKFADQAAA